MKKLGIVFGTRPEVIKMAPVIHEARRQSIPVEVLFTGQHRELTRPMMRFFDIEPQVDLDVMEPGQPLPRLAGKCLTGIEKVWGTAPPDALLVQGDTTTAFAAAYWGFTRQIPVGHVEAGLRTYRLDSPFPEEGNRQLISRIATHHFAPTETARRALMNEHVVESAIHVVGNTAIDALEYTRNRLAKNSVPSEFRLSQTIADFCKGGRAVAVTAHRRESFGEGMERICLAILELVNQDHTLRVVLPVHPNPQVTQVIRGRLSGHTQIHLCAPLDYVAFVELMDLAKVMITDSGGVQEEAPTFRKPIIVLRDTTERPEGVEAGFSVLVGTDLNKIVSETRRALRDGCRATGPNPYGDGKSAERILLGIR